LRVEPSVRAQSRMVCLSKCQFERSREWFAYRNVNSSAIENGLPIEMSVRAQSRMVCLSRCHFIAGENVSLLRCQFEHSREWFAYRDASSSAVDNGLHIEMSVRAQSRTVYLSRCQFERSREWFAYRDVSSSAVENGFPNVSSSAVENGLSIEMSVRAQLRDF
jgi:fibrillarin-like rRNA methylase